jgi:hypothetical protein
MYPPRTVNPLDPLKTLVLLHFLSVNPLETLGEMRVACKNKGLFQGVFGNPSVRRRKVKRYGSEPSGRGNPEE